MAKHNQISDIHKHLKKIRKRIEKSTNKIERVKDREADLLIELYKIEERILDLEQFELAKVNMQYWDKRVNN